MLNEKDILIGACASQAHLGWLSPTEENTRISQKLLYHAYKESDFRGIILKGDDIIGLMVSSLHYSVPTKGQLTEREFMELLYREGILLNLPTPHNFYPSEEEQAEQERLGKLFADEKPLSEIIIEDRGPY